MIKQKLVEVSEKEKFARFRRKVIVFRSFMQRAYGWIQVPGMVLMLAGVMYPYVKGWVSVNVWVMAGGVLVILAGVGFVERYLGFFKEDVSYGTEQNRLLLRRLDEIEELIREVKDEEGRKRKNVKCKCEILREQKEGGS